MGCVVFKLVAPPLKSGLPYVLTGSALKINGLTCGTAPALNDPNVATDPLTILVVLLPVPIGRSHELPLFLIRPISVFGKVVKVEPSKAVGQFSCTVALPVPLSLVIFHTASTTSCFCTVVNGVPVIDPFVVI